jgi:uncharacterized membrane protein YgdD (TMEM256/DUF423 family)
MKLNPAWLLAAAIGGAASVAAGALGSHFVAEPRAAAWLDTGARYGLAHAATLIGLAALSAGASGFPARLLAIAAWLFVAGLVLFSGGLAALALTGARPLAHVVPFGGAAYILGWAALGIAAAKAWRGR